MKTKICKGCGIEKPIDSFNRQTKNRDGRRNKCVACTREQERKYRRAVEALKKAGKTFGKTGNDIQASDARWQMVACRADVTKQLARDMARFA